MEKQYKSLGGHENIEVNELGDVRYVRNGKPAPVYFGSYGSYYVKYNFGEGCISMFNLVGRLFVPNPNNYKFIRAKDGDNSNYSASNLEWVKTRRRVQVNDE